MDPEVRDIGVPPLLLQPLVENAVRHGVAVSDGPVRVGLRAGRVADPDRLLVRVSDNGPGPVAEIGAGEGIENTRERILAFFGDGSLNLDRIDGVTVAEIVVPWRLARDM